MPSSPSPNTAAQSAQLSFFTDEWWSSGRHANALGWNYLNALSGLMCANMNAVTRASRLARQ
jgi:hypothetical protein